MNYQDAAPFESDVPVFRQFTLKTRVHKLNLKHQSTNSRTIYIKREDELSSGVIGSKLRKYASLIPSLKNEKTKQVALISGPNSNNAVAALQLIKEAGIEVFLFVRKAASAKVEGNALYAQMLCPKERIFEIERDQWPLVDSIAQEWADNETETGRETVAISEGAFDRKSLLGAMSLAKDILRNEAENDVVFKTLYIDSGSGLSAIGLILGLAFANTLARKIVVTLIAGSEQEFMQKLATARGWQEINSETSDYLGSIELRFLHPPTAKSYGTINQTLLDKTVSIAREYGLLMDPIYSVKHFMSMENDIHVTPVESPILFIYNGGSLGLSGFQAQLNKTLSKRI